MKKITRATFKSFIRKAGDNLFTKQLSAFNGMVDGVECVKDSFEKAIKVDGNLKNTLGYHDIWLVGGSRDYFTHYEDNNYIGIKYYNSCGSGIIAVEK